MVIFSSVHRFSRGLSRLIRVRSSSTASTTTSSPPPTSTAQKLISLSFDESTALATLTLNRPPVNALNFELMQQIKHAVQQLEQQQCRGMILTSSSERIFSAGLDLHDCYKADKERLTKLWCSLQSMWRAIFGTAIPTVALINGHALAGGCALAIACDYRVMLSQFKIGLNDTQVGIAVPSWLINSYINVVHNRRRAEADLIGSTIYNSGDAAKQVGLVDEVAANKQEAMEKCMKFLRSFDKRTAAASGQTKLLFRAQILEDFEKDRERDLDLFLQTIQSKSAQAFLGKYLEGLKDKKNVQKK